MTEFSRQIDKEEIERTGWQLIEPKLKTINANSVEETVLKIADQLGDVVVHGNYPQVMRIALIPGEEKSKSYFKTPIETPLHTDMAWWPFKPAQYIIMGCVRPAEVGGISRHANAFDTFRTLNNEDQQLLLDTKFKIAAAPHHELSQEMVIFDSGEQGVLKPAMVLGANGELSYVRLNPNADFIRINSDQPQKVLSAVRKWNNANQSNAETRFMTPGQIIVVANDRSVHKRTAYNDPTRLMLRAYSDPHPNKVNP